MSDKNDPSFITRLMTNESARKGIAAAAAGIIIAAVSEALWPSS